MSVEMEPPSTDDKYFLVDYVLSYNSDDTEKQSYRDLFLDIVKEESLQFDFETVGTNTFIKLTCPFDRLALEAERTKLEMPLKGLDIHPAEPSCCGILQKIMTTDDEIDFVSAPFEQSKLHIFEGFEDLETFFRSALRGFLVHNILINIDIREKLMCSDMHTEDDVVQKKGLLYLLMKKAFNDAFVMHDQSAEDPYFLRIQESSLDEYYKAIPNLKLDPRREMKSTWTRFWKFQPLWKIRNYFGEKIAFYFAWLGTFLTLLWIPAILGLTIFCYGIYERYTALTEDILGTIKESFDNVFTPFFSLIICLWSTLFLEIWKRNRYTLAYQWDVNTFKITEPDRPQFFGVCQREDPITGELAWIYPLSRRIRKFIVSFIVSGTMIIFVFISVSLVIAAKVQIRHKFKCPSDDEDSAKYANDPEAASRGVCLLLVTVLPTVVNAVSIMLLGWIYSKIAAKLTDWENHRTQSEYNDALIIKLFAFQFANTYTSLFYMAFFRPEDHGFQDNGVFGWGPEYKDTCQKGSCMSLLSFQVLVLMIVKPFPKFGKDIVWPWLKRQYRKMKRFERRNKVDDELNTNSGNNKETNSETSNSFIEREFLKPDGGDFTMEEYTEKVIMFGYIVMFAASFPLAPLIALIISLADMRVDANRLLWFNRRPIAFIASDIGMWYSILQFVNFCGAVSNAFIIAFTSSFCENLLHPDQCTPDKRLAIVLVFEHVVFLFMYIIGVTIPDVPASIKLAQRRERYQVQKILEEGKVPLRVSDKEKIRDKSGYMKMPNIEGINVGLSADGKIPQKNSTYTSLGDFARKTGTPESRKSLVSNDSNKDNSVGD